MKYFTIPANYLFSNYYQSIYTLIWSLPLKSKVDVIDSKNSHVLYSVADGKIMQHSFKFASQNNVSNIENINFYELINNEMDKGLIGLTELALFNDIANGYTYFTIGKSDGSIELYRLDENRVSKLCTFLNHNKLITIIKWNKNGSYLGSGSNDFNVVIIDFKSLVDRLNSTENLKLISNFKHKLAGHQERITGLSWSVHNENLLASCSYDGTVQVFKNSCLFFQIYF